MDDFAVRIENLTKVYRSWNRRRTVTAVKHLDLTVKKGAVVAFLGPNGAGKTTTIHCMLGLLKPDRGSLSTLGVPVGNSEIRRRIGHQSEIFYTYPFRTGASALRFYGRLSGLSPESLNEAVPRQLSRLGLSNAAGRKVGTFSKGMTQRLGLAQALLHSPELLVLDEPTTGLDPEGRKLVTEVIQEEKAKGTTIFFSSHILSDIERICDSVVIVRDGRVVVSSDLTDLKLKGDTWEIEVIGWKPEFDVSPVSDLVVGREERNGKLYLSTAGRDKEELLRTILNRPIKIGAVRPQSESLEDLYLKATRSPSYE